MAYLNNFESDVFISYAHYDDDTYPTEQLGWVARLHSDLEQRVGVHLGAEPALWRDRPEIRNNQEFENVILKRLVNTATFLAVVSPSFIKREWCIRELEAFAASAAQSLGVRLDGDKLRIFKVEKIEVDPDVLPQSLRGAEGYKFYAEHEFRPVMGGDNFRRYFEEMDDLAYDIADVLKSLSGNAAGNKATADLSAATTASLPTVYLAETTSDLAQQAEEIKRDLRGRGYSVLPAATLPDTSERLTAEVRDALKRSSLSVHLVGRNYGAVPEGAGEKSKAWLQHELAMQRGKDPNFVRLIWLSNDDGPADIRQLNFLRYLRDDSEAQSSAEFLQKKNIEEVKWILQQKLKTIQQKKVLPPYDPAYPASVSWPRHSDGPIRIYIICDQSDRGSPSLAALRKFLFDQGFEMILPSENTDEKESLQEHNDNMSICDVALIYYGGASERWLNAKLMDFRKILSRRAEPVLAKAIYIAPPDSPGKRDFATHEAQVLRGDEEFSPNSLTPLLNTLRSKPRVSA